MLRIKPTIFAALCLVAFQPASAAVHTVSYSKAVRNPGKVETISDQAFVVVRLPVRDFAQTSKYEVTYLAPQYGGSVFTFLATEHTDETFTPNLTIDGFPAQVVVRDGRSYNLQSDLSGVTEDPANYLFTVEHFCLVVARVKVGGIMLTFQQSFEKLKQPTGQVGDPYDPQGTGYVNIGSIPNASGWANWGAYHDPIGLVLAADTWIDFITITARD